MKNFYRFFFVVFSYYAGNIAGAIFYIADVLIGRNSFILEYQQRQNKYFLDFRKNEKVKCYLKIALGD